MNQKMTWEEIRKQYPDKFVLIDHCEEKKIDEAHTQIMGGEVVFTTDDGKLIFDEYRRRGKPSQMTFAHTHWPQLQVEEIPQPGLRFSNE